MSRIKETFLNNIQYEEQETGYEIFLYEKNKKNTPKTVEHNQKSCIIER